MAHLPPPLSSSSQKRGAYKLPERMRTMQDIRKLIIEGYPYDAIMEQLHIPHRTFYRYLSALFEDDRRLLAENALVMKRS
jgi:DNA invertase Pin-like site-specific DNA recombinase